MIFTLEDLVEISDEEGETPRRTLFTEQDLQSIAGDLVEALGALSLNLACCSVYIDFL